MQNHTTREILTALQYLLIGLAALAIMQQWFSHWSAWGQMAVWTIITALFSLLRLVLFALSEWVQGNRWQTIRRRNWD